MRLTQIKIKYEIAWSTYPASNREDGRVEAIADAGKPIYGVSDADLGCELLVEATIRFTDGTTRVLSATTARIRRQGDGGARNPSLTSSTPDILKNSSTLLFLSLALPFPNFPSPGRDPTDAHV